MHPHDEEQPALNPILKPGVSKDVSYTVGDCIQERLMMHPTTIVLFILALVIIVIVGVRGQIPGF